MAADLTTKPPSGLDTPHCKCDRDCQLWACLLPDRLPAAARVRRQEVTGCTCRQSCRQTWRASCQPCLRLAAKRCPPAWLTAWRPTGTASCGPGPAGRRPWLQPFSASSSASCAGSSSAPQAPSARVAGPHCRCALHMHTYACQVAASAAVAQSLLLLLLLQECLLLLLLLPQSSLLQQCLLLSPTAFPPRAAFSAAVCTGHSAALKPAQLGDQRG